MFFTRIPVPHTLPYSEAYLNQSSRYFPLVGTVVGLAAGAVCWLSALVLPPPVAVLLSMGCSIILTGGFHEDGLADACDGFGGGWTKERILEIMKDSRIGAFGAMGVIIGLLLKYTCLSALPLRVIPLVLVAGHSLSRWVAVSFLYSHEYVREEGKAKPLASQLSWDALLFAGFWGVLPLLFFGHLWGFLLILPLFVVKWALGLYFRRWIGGYTGDCLGAAQQVLEIVFYLGFLVLWKYI
jgi:adenosylcobinamide-GDP ribazoletransferase